ncbi:NifU-like protein [Mycoplasmoides gallisepticum NC08_2008.031-4-3P]|uniref:iron-sulfur cluster assembly scaffold protein n=1 Tax=Mycoplasmoides gallisepticum TaxID=2096 RepID=UPI0002778ECB|nr:iron-sulfur cluster assembly scaffold protein [Mycoplasmoides gallisepticum]AFP81187.1 NifU-like protein [Mycoplasmoides gallisepticum NC08_2008.031-4-3P]
MNYSNPLIRRQIIIDYYQNPKNFIKEPISDLNYKVIKTKSDSCVDQFDLYLLIKDDLLVDLKFSGSGCIISQATFDFLSKYLINKKLDEVKKLLSAYLEFIFKDVKSPLLAEEFDIFSSVHMQSNRIICATINAKALNEYLTKE